MCVSGNVTYVAQPYNTRRNGLTGTLSRLLEKGNAMDNDTLTEFMQNLFEAGFDVQVILAKGFDFAVRRLPGMDIGEAVFRGAEQRMRPMLMTAVSAGVGLFPAAISHGIGSQVQRPLATVVVGGMFIGPLLLLVVAPALRKIFLSRERSPVNDSEAAVTAEGSSES